MKKSDLLDYLAARADAPVWEVAHALGITEPAAGMALLRALRQQLVQHTLNPEDGTFGYRLTEHGRARRAYFRRQQQGLTRCA